MTAEELLVDHYHEAITENGAYLSIDIKHTLFTWNLMRLQQNAANMKRLVRKHQFEDIILIENDGTHITESVLVLDPILTKFYFENLI